MAIKLEADFVTAAARLRDRRTKIGFPLSKCQASLFYSIYLRGTKEAKEVSKRFRSAATICLLGNFAIYRRHWLISQPRAGEKLAYKVVGMLSLCNEVEID